jgi:hypothetical protein
VIVNAPRPSRGARTLALRRRHFVCYAETRDGVHWDPPALNLFELEGSCRNNILAGAAHRDTAFYNIFKEPASASAANGVCTT